ncbi:nucleoside triphosphate pyrophosphohydrolase [Sphingomicrobium sediminis]|uniref:Nucleoside triphosphate pyrophosphohydrolase n=1 Tax=Sphingomicrobium sediminis TaxID=2950949 RepID=A0A9X2J1J0_9SPHN|nr:nucleoside triphosphate pyrophosphohydrolase [Sphingomicrobium sediminis]MCM8556779.1 nucleoside triphosphate pyrophosphohydrolase [Sphingomicrobium sediminis]
MMGLDRLVAIMRRLRDKKTGCEWDSVQTFETIAPYTIEEAYEVSEAIHQGDMDGLADELGDLQLQVIFHSVMAEEIGAFTLDDVFDRICDKMERRHPHIFGDAKQGGHQLWEEIKAAERKEMDDQSALAGVALALPALERAQKLQKRAARTGFDWPDASGAKAKIAEELAELEAAGNDAEREEELGDLLFAVVNLARFLKVDSEEALRKANRKFEKRFRTIEAHPDFAEADLDGKEALWREAKKA